MLRGWTKSAKTPFTGREARRAKRLRSNALTCELGTVVDISKTGMRVRAQSKPPVKVGQMVPISLLSESCRIRVSAMVVWVKRKGIKTFEVGLKFVQVTASLTAAVESLAMFGFIDLEAAAARKQQPGSSVRVEIPDYYETLELRPGASAREIKDAYRALARRYHPDVCKDPEGADRFIRITEAYEVLSDPRARKSYDQRY